MEKAIEETPPPPSSALPPPISLHEWWSGGIQQQHHHHHQHHQHHHLPQPPPPQPSKENNTTTHTNNKNRQRTTNQKRLPLMDIRSKNDFDQRRISSPCCSSTLTIAADRDIIMDPRNSHTATTTSTTSTASSTATTCTEKLPLVEEGRGTVTAPNVVVIHLPWETLVSGERSCELPPRHVEFALLVPSHYNKDDTRDNNHNHNHHNKNDQNEVQEPTITEFFVATASRTTGQSRKPWNVKQVLVDSPSLWKEAEELGILQEVHQDEVGDEGIIQPKLPKLPKHGSRGRRRMRPLPRLWKPDGMVEHTLYPMLQDVLKDILLQQSNAAAGRNKHQVVPHFVWDLGSGAGRDICFLAEESKAYYMARQQGQLSSCSSSHSSSSRSSSTTTSSSSSIASLPIQFVGVDHHKGSAQRCLPFWKHHSIHDCTQTKRLNLKQLKLVKDAWEEVILARQDEGEEQSTQPSRFTVGERLICLYAVRYWNRPLVQYIVDSTLLSKGTIFALSHFCKPFVGASWDYDHPKVRRILRHDTDKIV